MSEQDVMRFLDRVPLLSGLPEEYRTLLAKHLERKTFRAGEIICREGEEGDALYIIGKGQVAVVTGNEELGLEVELARLRSGQVFGEMAILTREKRSATCRAVEDTVALALGDKVFAGLLNRAPQIAIKLCQILAKRLSKIQQHQNSQSKIAGLVKAHINSLIHSFYMLHLSY